MRRRRRPPFKLEQDVLHRHDGAIGRGRFHLFPQRWKHVGRIVAVLRKKSRRGGLKTILVMETAENRSGGDTMPVRKPMTG
jgi:hypothetical protein